MPRRLIAISMLSVLGLAGCGAWPDPQIPGDAAARAAPWPTLLPISAILAGAPAAAAGPAAPPAERIAALRSRAAALRGPVIDGAARARLSRGIDLSAFPGVR